MGTTDQSIRSITEGETSVLVFKKKFSKKGPGSKSRVPFYNPAMELNRDLSILVGQWLVNQCDKKMCFLDGLAASGICGMRLANEINGDLYVVVNDWNKYAYDLIKENLKNCKLENLEGDNSNLNVLLSENRYDYIDVDPFGSPVFFIDSAIRSISNDGVLACTATDTATLCGVYPKVCLRRYGARPFHSPAMHEIGLRILIGFICREAAKYDKGIEPLVCYSTDHYFRVYVRVRKGKSNANEAIENLATIKTERVTFVVNNKHNFNIGPLWMGKLQNDKVIKCLRSILSKKKLNTKNMLWRLLDLLEEESDAPAFFYTTNDLASLFKTSPPNMKKIFEKMRNDGYKVVRTHFSPTGFKTNADKEVIEKVFKEK